jgi:hypothetical protein
MELAAIAVTHRRAAERSGQGVEELLAGGGAVVAAELMSPWPVILAAVCARCSAGSTGRPRPV